MTAFITKTAELTSPSSFGTVKRHIDEVLMCFLSQVQTSTNLISRQTSGGSHLAYFIRLIWFVGIFFVCFFVLFLLFNNYLKLYFMQHTQVLGSLNSTSKSHETLNVYTDRLWPCRICTYVIVLKLCECCVLILGESIVFVHCNLFVEIIVELKWQKHQRLIISVLVTHTLLMWVGFFMFLSLLLKKTVVWRKHLLE